MNKSSSISLLSTFSNFNPQIKQTLADIKKPLLLCFAALALAKDFAERDYLSAEHIVAVLEAADVAINRNQVVGALSKANDMVSKKVISDEVYYRLMTLGRRRIEPFLGLGPIQLIYIKSGMPVTARNHLKDILATLPTGTRICDPYYGVRSFESLLSIPSNSKIKFLTSHTSEKNTLISGAIKDFKIERPNTEIKILHPSNILHDRYILTTDNLYILGQGIKDIGVKESFILSISNSFAADLINELIKRFDNIWNNASTI